MAVVGQRYFTPNPFEFDARGVPLAGGQLFFYVTDSSTPLDTYADVDLTTLNPNPVVADANGRFGTIFMTPTTAYKVMLFTAATDLNPDGVEIWTEDPCGPAAGGTIANTAGIVGEVRAFAGIEAAIPTGWYLCYGQAVSRSTYATLFSVLGTTWGAGDSSTTFNLPDLRGRALFGKDDMGGVGANRITAGVSGLTGTTLGATGGNQALQQHGHDLNDPGHAHDTTELPHTHPIQLQDDGDGPADGQATSIGGADSTDGVTDGAVTDLTVDSNVTGITIDNEGAGDSQNIPPAAIVNMIIYAGV